MQDLHVREILPQTIPLSESYIQIWSRRPKLNQKESKLESMDQS